MIVCQAVLWGCPVPLRVQTPVDTVPRWGRDTLKGGPTLNIFKLLLGNYSSYRAPFRILATGQAWYMFSIVCFRVLPQLLFHKLCFCECGRGKEHAKTEQFILNAKASANLSKRSLPQNLPRASAPCGVERCRCSRICPCPHCLQVASKDCRC